MSIMILEDLECCIMGMKVEVEVKMKVVLNLMTKDGVILFITIICADTFI